MKYAELGSISSGTMRSEDLLPAYIGALRDVRGAIPKRLLADVRKYESGATLAPEYKDDILSDLHDALHEYAPPYAYFGAHPGDGADYGFWLHEDFPQMVRDDGAEVVSDTSEIPKGYRGPVLHVNDHGNATLYYCTKRGKLRAIWSVV